MMSDFSFSKKEESRGVYGKRTTVYGNYKFDQKKPKEFYRTESNPYDPLFKPETVLFGPAIV